MDKGWIHALKFSKRYVEGVQSFMQFVRSRFDRNSKIRCPCDDCLNINFQTLDVVYDHLLLKGFKKDYVNWNYHGEKYQMRDNDETIYGEDENEERINEEHVSNNEMHAMLEEISGRSQVKPMEETETGNKSCDNLSESEAKKFEKLLKEAERELYPGCKKFYKLSFLVKLLHLKVYNQWSNKSFNMLLELLRDAFPDGETLPKSHYDAKSMLQGLGLGYISIHACKYDCVLYWNEFKDRQECPHCGTSRWKIDKAKGKKIPHKVLRYFPLKPRLQRLFMSRKTSTDMRWHKEKYQNDTNVLRHPVDSDAWKEFDKTHTWFAQEPRNVRLGLATDGFNPFGNMSTTYSMWPVILFPYNLPPWKCFKDPFMMMSLLIPGPQAPGKDIDVYLRPLIDELNELWSDGVETFDASTGECFKMHAAVLWTINDFPAYGNLSGWSTKGYMACPICNKDAPSKKIRSKICYMDHRRHLERSHRWRRSKKFNGKIEKRLKPKKVSGDDVLQQLDLLSTYMPGKHPNNKKRKRLPIELNWVRKSIFFELPYWKDLKLPNNLDVMHIEKNICESVVGTLLNIAGKSKDTYKARQDLEDMDIRQEQWLQHDGSGYTMPFACYNMSEKEKKLFWAFLKSVKFPDGYASNISGCVSEDGGKISKLKSHDYHVLLQRLLPIALRGYRNKDVSLALIELGHFFQRLCCKTLKRDDLEQLEKDIVIILCKLEMIFPPAFFDVMVHLAVHLPREAMYGGPVQYRWMYKIERFLCKLKRYVRNKARPEGSITEGYIIDECLTFCSMYLSDIETRFNREDRNADGPSTRDEHVLDIFSESVRPFKGVYDALPKKDFDMARWYVLNNCEEVEPFLKEHKEELTKKGVGNIKEKHREQFPLWFKKKIMQLYNKDKSISIKKLYPLAMEPDLRGRKCPGCIVNGVRYHTQSRDELRKCQNSGVVVEGYHEKDVIDFYGTIVDIIELEYVDGNRVVLFKCKWFDLRKNTGMQKDKNFTSVNVKRFWYEHDSFVLATQVKQVFYIDDPKLGGNWRIVQKFQDRHIYDVPEMQNSEVECEELCTTNDDVYQDVSVESSVIDNDIEDVLCQLHRDDVDSTTLDSRVVELEVQTGHEVDYNTEDSDQEDDTMIEYISDHERNEGTKSTNKDEDDETDYDDDDDLMM